MTNISTETTENGILVITIDVPGKKVNSISRDVLDEISSMISSIRNGESVKGVVIISAKDDCFVAGADIEGFRNMTEEEEIREYITMANDFLNELEDLHVPVVCAINGSCLGGGMELALAADYRIASDSPKTVFGLPEVKIGLLPAGGGTQRMPKLIGLKRALPLMLTGSNVRVKKALKMGLIDELAMPPQLKDAALRRVLELSKGRIKRKKRRVSLTDILLEKNPIGRALVFSQAKKMVMKLSHGLYPAPLEIIDSVSYGCTRGVRRGITRDIDRLVKLVMSPQAKSLMNLFFAMTAHRKNSMKDRASSVDKLAVIGAGFMGSGIASVSTSICDTILMKDIDMDAASRGVLEVWKGLEKRAKSGAITSFEKDTLYGKLVPCDDYGLFRNTDLVIEAVFEDIELKKRVVKDIEEAADEKTIIASNTSALPITSIAENAARPENIVGMHYFSPVPKMPLLEIIKTEKTSERTIATALDFGIRQGKTCIIVHDGPGFYTTRILGPLLNEAVLLAEEGVTIQDIDRAMNRFGYPVGPITLIDEVGIDVGAHVMEELGDFIASRGGETSGSLPQLFKKGFLGRKNKMGFYSYDAPKRGGMRQANIEAMKVIGVTEKKKADEDVIQKRCSLMMINEAARCLEEDIISSPGDGDIGAILGLGFPPFTGGPFRYIDSEGINSIVEVMEAYGERFGKRFYPADILRDMASGSKKFYT